MRKIIGSIIGIVLVTAAVYIGNVIIEKNTRPKPKFKKTIKTVFVEPVVNKEIPIVLTASGTLVAKRKIELYSEVQGVLKTMSKPFKPGVQFSRGQIILSLNSAEFYASLQAQKSSLFNLITAIMPDLRLDYPNSFEKWNTYLEAFDINKVTPKLPEFSSDKEKYFISGRGITSAYYTVKTAEVKLAKYNIRAPFSGVLTEALVTPGTLVRQGQKLGEFIDSSIFEMEVSINAAYSDLLKTGDTVTLFNLERTTSYQGQVMRVNGKVDMTSQSVKVFIQVAHADLKEGMYLEADLRTRTETNAYEVARKLLVENSSVYTVKNDSILQLVKVNPVYFGSETVVFKGLENGTKILTQALPGAFDGMIVNSNTKH